MKKRRNLLPGQQNNPKRQAIISLNKSDQQIRQEILTDLQNQRQEDGKEGWYDAQDSPMENYLRFMTATQEGGKNESLARSVENLLDAHRTALHHLRKAKSSVICDISNANIGRLETVNRKYIEKHDFLVEPDPAKHRLCAMGSSCLCMTMAAHYPDTVQDLSADSHGFVGREFLLPTQLERFQSTNVLPLYRRHCIVCNRALTCLAYTQMLHEGEEPDHMIMDHKYDSLDQPGEYLSKACLSIVIKNLKTTVSSHFLEYCANRYDYAKRKGKKRLLEINVVVQDFPLAPSSSKGKRREP